MGTTLITGGTGFVGTELRARLTDRDVRLLVRDPDRISGHPQGTVVRGDVLNPESLAAAMAGVDTVVHLVAIIEESGGRTFDQVIRGGTEHVVSAASMAGVKRFVHMSALGARDDPAYPYLHAKWNAEQAVKSAPFDWTIFRPSVIFGPRDGFINVLANLVRRTPVIPIAGSGLSSFQPVAVADVADGFRRALDDRTTIGKTYEIGGGEKYSYEEMIDLLAAHLGKRRAKVHVPVSIMRAIVAVSAPLPRRLRPPVTAEQLRMLAIDNSTPNSATADLIGREPVSLRNGIDYVRR